MAIFTWTLRKIQRKSEFEYQVINPTGDVVATRRSKRDYVACFVYVSKDPENPESSKRGYNATHWFGRPELIGKGDSGRHAKAVREPDAIALIETIRDHSRPGAWSDYPLTRTADGEPIRNFEGTGISWYGMPTPYRRGVGFTTAINRDHTDLTNTGDRLKLPTTDPVVAKIVEKMYGDTEPAGVLSADEIEGIARELDALSAVKEYPIAVVSNRATPPQIGFVNRKTLDAFAFYSQGEATADDFQATLEKQLHAAAARIGRQDPAAVDLGDVDAAPIAADPIKVISRIVRPVIDAAFGDVGRLTEDLAKYLWDRLEGTDPDDLAANVTAALAGIKIRIDYEPAGNAAEGVAIAAAQAAFNAKIKRDALWNDAIAESFPALVDVGNFEVLDPAEGIQLLKMIFDGKDLEDPANFGDEFELEVAARRRRLGLIEPEDAAADPNAGSGVTRENVSKT